MGRPIPNAFIRKTVTRGFVVREKKPFSLAYDLPGASDREGRDAKLADRGSGRESQAAAHGGAVA